MKYIKRRINSLLRKLWCDYWVFKTGYAYADPGIIYPFSGAPTLFIRWIAVTSNRQIEDEMETSDGVNTMMNYRNKAREEILIRRFYPHKNVKELE